MASTGVHPSHPAPRPYLGSVIDPRRLRQLYHRRFYIELLQQQYLPYFLTSSYLPRLPTIGSFSLLPSEALLPQVPQQHQLLGRIDSRWQAVDIEMSLKSSSRGSHSLEY